MFLVSVIIFIMPRAEHIWPDLKQRLPRWWTIMPVRSVSLKTKTRISQGLISEMEWLQLFPSSTLLRDLKDRPRQSSTIRMQPRLQARFSGNSWSFILTGIWKLSKPFSPVQRRLPRSERRKREPRRIFWSNRNIPLTLMANWQTVRRKILLSVRFLS